MDFSSIAPIIAEKHTENSNITQKGEKMSAESAGKAFEAMFYQTVLSTMTKSITNTSKNQSNQMQEDWSWSLLTQTISQQMAEENHLKIGQMLDSQISKK